MKMDQLTYFPPSVSAIPGSPVHRREEELNQVLRSLIPFGEVFQQFVNRSEFFWKEQPRRLGSDKTQLLLVCQFRKQGSGPWVSKFEDAFVVLKEALGMSPLGMTLSKEKWVEDGMILRQSPFCSHECPVFEASLRMMDEKSIEQEKERYLRKVESIKQEVASLQKLRQRRFLGKRAKRKIENKLRSLKIEHDQYVAGQFSPFEMEPGFLLTLKADFNSIENREFRDDLIGIMKNFILGFSQFFVLDATEMDEQRDFKTEFSFP